MFHNDSFVLTKYWAEIWWNPQRLSKEIIVSRIIINTAKLLHGALCDSPGWWSFHSLYLRKYKIMCSLFLIPKPQDAHYQHSSIRICISSEKQNSKSFQATSVLLGNHKHWQLGEMKIPLSSPSKLTQEVTRGLLKLPCYTDHNLDRERPPLGMRQFRFLSGSLLTIPQNSQPQTTKKPDSRTLPYEWFWHC